MDYLIHPFTQHGIRNCVIWHALMAVVCLAATIGVVGFGFLAVRSAVYLAISLAGLTLTSLYLAIAIGLSEYRPWARRAGIFMGEGGAGVALFLFLAALLPVVHTVPITMSFWLLLAGALAVYLLFSVVEVAVILFLVSPRTAAAFSNEAYAGVWPDPLSPLELFSARILRSTGE
jgi:hypothetical protein